jgi:hypothetical protein
MDRRINRRAARDHDVGGDHAVADGDHVVDDAGATTRTAGVAQVDGGGLTLPSTCFPRPRRKRTPFARGKHRRLHKIRGREGEAFVAARQADGLERQSDERVQQVIKLVEDLQRRLAKAEPAKPASTYIELGHAVRTE